MQLFHIVPDISAEANGVTPVIRGLAVHAVAEGHRFVVSTLGMQDPPTGVEVWTARRSRYLRRLEHSPDFFSHLSKAAREFDIIHNHSLWSACNLLSGVVRRPRAKLVTSPHGTLSPWALDRRKWLKKALWPMQSQALFQADLLHATAASEVDDLRRLGFRKPIALIPNGIDLPIQRNSRISGDVAERTVLFVSRLHPVKGLENLLSAWQHVAHRHPNWMLKIAGTGDPSYERQLLTLAQTLSLPRVQWLGPVYGQAKSTAYSQADLFVLPTFSENFGMVVAEALSHGCPVIIGKGAPWSELEARNAGWWVDNDVPTLIGTLDSAMGLPATTLAAMGQQGRDWMQAQFAWPTIADRFMASYRWLTLGGSRPDWIFEA